MRLNLPSDLHEAQPWNPSVESQIDAARHREPAPEELAMMPDTVCTPPALIPGKWIEDKDWPGSIGVAEGPVPGEVTNTIAHVMPLDGYVGPVAKLHVSLFLASKDLLAECRRIHDRIARQIEGPIPITEIEHDDYVRLARVIAKAESQRSAS